MKLKIQNVVDETKILITLEKQTVVKSWRFETNEFGNTDKLYQIEEIIRDDVDMDHIYFNDMVPENRMIELPDFLMNQEILVRARAGIDTPMVSIDHRIILTEDTTLAVIQQPDIAY